MVDAYDLKKQTPEEEEDGAEDAETTEVEEIAVVETEFTLRMKG